MPSWRFERGENALFEGTVLIATSSSSPKTAADLTGGTLYLHFGSSLGSPMKSWTAGGSSLQITTATSGVYQFEWQPEDTQDLAIGVYYWDLWYKNTANKEYCVTVGTLTLLSVVGTI